MPKTDNFSFPGPVPQEALDYFRAKGYRVGFDYRDVWRQEHVADFTVAKVMELDLLADIRNTTDEAIAKGLTFHTFQKELKPILESYGWWGKREMVDPFTGEAKPIHPKDGMKRCRGSISVLEKLRW